MPDDVDITKEFLEGTAIDEALERAARRARREHKRAGHPIVVWENGEVVLVPPEEIPDEDEDDETS